MDERLGAAAVAVVGGIAFFRWRSRKPSCSGETCNPMQGKFCPEGCECSSVSEGTCVPE